jgi:hypothetical protein
MVKIVFYLFFAFSFYLLLRKRWEFIFFIPNFNLISDMSFSFFGGLSEPTFLRAVIILIFYIFTRKGFKSKGLYWRFYIFFIYILILLIFTNEFTYSAKAVSQVIFSMGMFLIGFAYINTIESYHRLVRSLFWFILLSFSATLVGYLFGIGKELEYITTDSNKAPEIVGLLGSGGLYSAGIALAMLPLLFKEEFGRYGKPVLIIASFLVVIFIILNVRRTAVLIPVVGVSGFLFYANIRLKILKYLIFFALGILLVFPLFSNLFFERYKIRQEQGRFEKEFYKTEERYLENILMFQNIKKFEDPKRVLFGIGNNIFAEHIKDGKIVRRMFHSDSAKIYYGSGLFGLVLYFMIYIAIFSQIIRIPNQGFYRDLKSALIGLFLISLVVTLNGSINLITFRSVNFLFMGSFLGLANSLYKEYGRILPG